MFLFPSLLIITVACQEEPPYDLSQIPVKEEVPQNVEAVTADAPLVKSSSPGPNQQCLPQNESIKEINLEDKIVVSLSLPEEAKRQQIILDFIDPSVGNVLYGIVCEGNQLKVPVSKNLGTVKLAVFIDVNKDGPSADDTQGLSDIVKIQEENITLEQITLGNTPLNFYNYGKAEPTSPPKEPPPELK